MKNNVLRKVGAGRMFRTYSRYFLILFHLLLLSVVFLQPPQTVLAIGLEFDGQYFVTSDGVRVIGVVHNGYDETAYDVELTLRASWKDSFAEITMFNLELGDIPAHEDKLIDMTLPYSFEKPHLVEITNDVPRYGQLGEENNGCLIVTAAWGSSTQPEVELMREYRDHLALTTETGHEFIVGFNSLYYLFSPKIADLISESSVLREIVRFSLLPASGLVRVASIPLRIDSLSHENSALLSIMILVSGFVFSYAYGVMEIANLGYTSSKNFARKRSGAPSQSGIPS